MLLILAMISLVVAFAVETFAANLNGHDVEFEFNSARVALGGDKIIFSNNQHADIAPATLGDFGAGDFVIQFTYSGVGSDATADGTYGALFIRSSNYKSPYTGPSAFLFDSGKIEFRFDFARTYVYV